MRLVLDGKGVAVGMFAGAAAITALGAAELAQAPARNGRGPFEYQTFTWEAGQEPTKMIRQEDGFCYLSSISGALDGGGEAARVYVGEDGFWYLGGETLNGYLKLSAVAVKPRSGVRLGPR
jgi:hypothetical protein